MCLNGLNSGNTNKIQIWRNEIQGLIFYFSIGEGMVPSMCPGPGSSWGNLTVPPASKEAESPSNYSMWILCGGGRTGFEKM